MLADVTDRVTTWGKSGDYFPGPWASTVFQDKNYGVPDNSNCLVQWYNKAFTDPAGVPPPRPGMNSGCRSKALTDGDRFGIAMSAVKSEEGTFQWLPFLWMTGEDLATLDSDGGRMALQLWVDLVKDGSMSPGILSWTQGDVKGQFQNGKAALMVNGPWQIPTLKSESPDLQWDVATLPEQKQGASILGGENLAIVKDTKNLDAAWDLHDLAPGARESQGLSRRSRQAAQHGRRWRPTKPGPRTRSSRSSWTSSRSPSRAPTAPSTLRSRPPSRI